MQCILLHQHFALSHFPEKNSQNWDDHIDLIFCSTHCNSDFKSRFLRNCWVYIQETYLEKMERRNSSAGDVMTESQVSLINRFFFMTDLYTKKTVELYITSEVSHRDSSLFWLHLLIQAFIRIIFCLVKFQVPSEIFNSLPLNLAYMQLPV